MLTFSLPFPPSSNTAYPTYNGRRIKSAKLLAWIREASISLVGIKPVEGRAILTYTFDLPDLRLRDVGNYEKVVTDLLVQRGILPDDNFRYVKEIVLRWSDKKGDTVQVQVEDALPCPF